MPRLSAGQTLSSNDSSRFVLSAPLREERDRQRYILRDRDRCSLRQTNPERPARHRQHLHEDAIYTTTKLSKIKHEKSSKDDLSSRPLDGKSSRIACDLVSHPVMGFLFGEATNPRASRLGRQQGETLFFVIQSCGLLTHFNHSPKRSTLHRPLIYGCLSRGQGGCKKLCKSCLFSLFLPHFGKPYQTSGAGFSPLCRLPLSQPAVETKGLEPSTPALQRQCSPN